MDKAELKAKIEDLQKQLDNFELDPDENETSYCEMIDELDTVKIGCLEYQASRVLREIDPIAYRCGLLDYVDGLEVSDDPRYKELQETLEETQDELDALEDAEDEG